MSLPYIELTDAVTDYINAQTFVPAVTAVRKYSAWASKQELTTLRCTVIPGPIEREPMTFGTGRGKELYTQEVWVVLQQKVPNGSATVIDPLVDLITKISDSLRRVPMELSDTVGQWIDNKDIVPFDAEAITSGVFMSAFSAVYQVEVGP